MGYVERLILSNGVFRVDAGRVYVGGCPYEDSPCFDNKSHERLDWIPTNVPENNHDAKGTLVVAGGEFNASTPVLVGVDGTGTVEMHGSAGSFTASSMVLSNATASAVRFVADASGFSPVNVTGALAVSDGASVEVDLSAYSGSTAHMRLFNFASFSGNLDDVSLTVLNGGSLLDKKCYLRRNGSAIELVIVTGTMMIIR